MTSIESEYTKVPATPSSSPIEKLDAIVIGAGINGLHALYRLREMGLNVRTLEAGGGVGGAWYWNRYPGARLDSESFTYGYFFSEEVQDEWSWSESFAGQPELERYFNFVADRLDLRKSIEFNTRVTSAVFDEATDTWLVTAEDGREFEARYVVVALGILSAPQFPNVPGLEDFEGEWYHTGLWPSEDVALSGKRVAVIGTGASGVQVISAIAADVEQLTVFQRTPNWATPINNQPISPERAAEISATRKEIYQTCYDSRGGFIHDPRAEFASEVSRDERLAYYNDLWYAPGLTMYQANFSDVLSSEETNRELSEFIAGKIRERIADPAVAEHLIPKDHGFGMRRPPLETNYYEAYNRDNVLLVPTVEQPITRFTATGIQTSESHHEFDTIVLATGFDAVTGAYLRIDFRGVGGVKLSDHWADGPRTALGMLTAGFPNLFILAGPHSVSGNNPRGAEHQVKWIANCIDQMIERGSKRIHPTLEAEDKWTEHAYSTIEGNLQSKTDSWYHGSNVPGKKRAFLLYAGGQPQYRASILKSAAEGYPGFVFDE